MKELIKEMFRVDIFSSVVYLLLGILLFTVEGEVLQTISIIIGIFLVIAGTFPIISYFKDKEKPFKTVNLISGVILLVSGIILIVYKSLLENVIAIIIGVIMIVNSVSKIEYTLTLRDNEVPAWVISMVFSIITLLLGIFFVVNTFKAMNLLTKTLGLIIIIYAVIDIIEITVLKFKLKKAMNKVDDNIKIIDEK